ncbi:MAG: GDP-mannose 4,6-dehydratase [Gaiellaceae bacterium]
MTGSETRVASVPVLVTGAGGFIGSHLVEGLVRAGAQVRAFVRYTSTGGHGHLDELAPDVAAEVEIYRGDLADGDAVAGAVDGRGVVFHLGAVIPIPYSFRHPREYVAVNVEGTLNVLQAARDGGVERIVQMSSSEVYGSAQTVPISEEHPLRAQSPYAATKIGADQLALSFQRSFGLPVVVARPFNTFGPRQSARAVIPAIAAQALTGSVVELGSLEPTRDFLYVADNVAGLIRCATVPGIEGETLNLGTGSETSIGEVAEKILAALGSSASIVTVDERVRPAEAEVDRLVADTSKARRLLSWEPETPFEDGLRHTLDWVRDHLAAYRPAVYNV